MFWKNRLEMISRKLHEILLSDVFIIEKLENQERLLRLILRKEMTSMGQIDDLKANVAKLIDDVTAEGTVITSAVAAIKGLTDQQAILSGELAAAIAANDPAAIQAASDAIAAQNQLVIDQTAALAAAVAAIPTPPAAEPVMPHVG